jgi:hypothetical protein
MRLDAYGSRRLLALAEQGTRIDKRLSLRSGIATVPSPPARGRCLPASCAGAILLLNGNIVPQSPTTSDGNRRGPRRRFVRIRDSARVPSD